jgi:hypothetical protein
MSTCSRENSPLSRCGTPPISVVPHLECARAGTPPKTSIISSVPYLARWGAAKFGTGSCRTAAPAAPPLGGGRWGGAVGKRREVTHPQCRLNHLADGVRSIGRALEVRSRESAGVNLGLGAISPWRAR